MKSKIIVSILLAVLMLGTLAVPALAAKPEGGWCDAVNSENGNAKYVFQATHNNDLKITVTLTEASFSNYEILLTATRVGGGGASLAYSSITPNDRGRVRFSVIEQGPFAPGDWDIDIEIYSDTPDPYELRFESTAATRLHFK